MALYNSARPPNLNLVPPPLLQIISSPPLLARRRLDEGQLCRHRHILSHARAYTHINLTPPAGMVSACVVLSLCMRICTVAIGNSKLYWRSKTH